MNILLPAVLEGRSAVSHSCTHMRTCPRCTFDIRCSWHPSLSSYTCNCSSHGFGMELIPPGTHLKQRLNKKDARNPRLSVALTAALNLGFTIGVKLMSHRPGSREKGAEVRERLGDVGPAKYSPRLFF